MPSLRPILLVEDNANEIELVQAAIRRNRLENPVEIARHGGEALDYLRCEGKYADRPKEDPAFVLLDLKMPKVDGHEVLAQVKSDVRLKTIPIVMLTTSAEKRDVTRSYQLGVNAYVVKPVDFLQFVTMMKQLCVFWADINLSLSESA